MEMDRALQGKTIIVGVSGSIAAYKAADLVSQLRKLGADPFVVMTHAAEQFITPLTLEVMSRNPVTRDFWDKRNWRAGHIELADKADLLLVAPATANLLAKFANGLADDELTALYLACRAPVLIAPAMNGKMFSHPATEANLETLRKRGHFFIGPEEGMLACGYEGQGRLWPVEEIVARVVELLSDRG